MKEKLKGVVNERGGAEMGYRDTLGDGRITSKQFVRFYVFPPFIETDAVLVCPVLYLYFIHSNLKRDAQYIDYK